MFPKSDKNINRSVEPTTCITSTHQCKKYICFVGICVFGMVFGATLTLGFPDMFNEILTQVCLFFLIIIGAEAFSELQHYHSQTITYLNIIGIGIYKYLYFVSFYL